MSNLSRRLIMLKPMRAGVSGYARLQTERGRTMVQLHMRGLKVAGVRAFWYLSGGEAVLLGAASVNPRGEASLTAELPEGRVAPERMQALLALSDGDDVEALMIGLCVQQSAGSLLDAKNAALALCERLRGEERRRKEKEEREAAGDEPAALASERQTPEKPATGPMVDGGGGISCASNAEPARTIPCEQTQSHMQRQGQASEQAIPTPISAVASSAHNKPDAESTLSTPCEQTQPQAQAPEQPTPALSTANNSGASYTPNAEPASHITGEPAQPSSQSTALPPVDNTSPPNAPSTNLAPLVPCEQTQPHRQPQAQSPKQSTPAHSPYETRFPAIPPRPHSSAPPADRLRPLQWPKGFEQISAFFRDTPRFALFRLPGWRFVYAAQGGGPEGLWIGYWQADGRVRQVAYAVRGDHPPAEGYRAARGIDGNVYQVLWQRV